MRFRRTNRWVVLGCGVALAGMLIVIWTGLGSNIPAAKVGDRLGDAQLRLPRNNVDPCRTNWNRFRRETIDAGWLSGTPQLEYHVKVWWRAPRDWVVVERESLYYFPRDSTNYLDYRLAKVSSQWKLKRKPW